MHLLLKVDHLQNVVLCLSGFEMCPLIEGGPYVLLILVSIFYSHLCITCPLYFDHLAALLVPSFLLCGLRTTMLGLTLFSKALRFSIGPIQVGSPYYQTLISATSIQVMLRKAVSALFTISVCISNYLHWTFTSVTSGGDCA